VIVNRQHVIDRAAVGRSGDLLTAVEHTLPAEPLRWFVSEVTPTSVVVESTEYEGTAPSPLPEPAAVPANGTDVVVSIVPTGIGCEIGGYAGDAAPATALLGAAADYVVTNPNAVNASNFISVGPNVLYTEGYCIDLFLRGAANLHRPRANRVGLIVEQADTSSLEEVFNVVNTARAVFGVDVVDFVVTDGPVGTTCVRNASGAYVGRVEHPDVLLAAAGRLLDAGADAIAVTTQVRGLTKDEYTSHFVGANPNPVGGAEAVISHLIARTYGVPAAHAPMINFKDIGLPSRVVDARGAGEFASISGLACVLIGLRQAPQLTTSPRRRTVDTIGVNQVVAVVAPATALGGLPVLHAARRRIPVIAVRENDTILDVTADKLGLDGVVEVANYVEAAGVVLALRNGISLDSLRRPLATLGGYAESEVARVEVPVGENA
jgi:Protein of unknown function (DUF3326)